MKFIGAAIISSLAIVFAYPATAVPIAGTLTEYFTDFTGTIDPIDLEIQGQILNTGPISFGLDPSKKTKEQRIVFDFSNNTAEYAVDLLIDAPLLSQLGEPSQSIRIELSGPITSVTPADFAPFVLTDVEINFNSLAGDSVFGPGQLFSGWVYSNFQINEKSNTIIIDGDGNTTNVKNPAKAEANLSGSIQANLRSPGGLQNIPLSGSGSARVVSIPEPATLALMTAGLAIVLLVGLRPVGRHPL